MVVAVCLTSFVVADAQKLIPTTDEKGRAGYANESGSIVIPCKYEATYPFHNGKARVQKGGKFGIVDVNGVELLPCKYDQIRPMGPGLPYRIVSGGKYGLVDANTFAVIIPCKYTYISKFNRHGMAWIASGGKISEGKLVGAKYGTASAEGVCIPATYPVLAEFCGQTDKGAIGKHSLVPQSLKGHLSDTLVTRAEYMAFNKLDIGLGYGLLDKKGNVLLPSKKVSYMARPRGGMMRVWTAKNKSTYNCAYFDLSTKQYINVGEIEATNFNDVGMPTHGDFMGEVAPVCTAAKTWKIVNRQGTSIGENFSSMKFGRGREYGEGYVAGRTEKGTYKVYDSEGVELLPGKSYEDVEFPNFKKDDVEAFLVMKGGKWGAVDRSGKVLLPTEYDAVHALRHGLFTAKKFGKWGMITPENKEYVPCKFSNIIFNDVSNPAYVWVNGTEKDTYEVYDVRAQKVVSNNQFVTVCNYEGDYAWAKSKKAKISQKKEYKELAGDKSMQDIYADYMTSYASAHKIDAEKVESQSGNIYDKSGNPCFCIVVPLWLADEAQELARKYNGQIPMSRQRDFLVKHASSYMKIDMNGGRISEGLWDY